MLQDPGLAFHPPFLYLGYVGFSVAFAFAVAALIEGRVDAAWARWVRPWTLASWCALTIGIAMGSWWAYYTLGWGGWWFWDPVENASFMPWLVGTALIHSAIVVEKRDTLKSWTILLAIITFSLSLVGTFLVRSGVLTSVHAFATDPARGTFILLLLVVAIGGSLTLYAVRAPSLKGGGLFAPISREGALRAEQSAAVLRLRHGVARHALSAVPRCGRRAETLGRASVLQPHLRAADGADASWRSASARCCPGSAAICLARCSACGAAYVAAAVAVMVAFYVTHGGPILAVLGFGLAAWTGAAVVAEWAERVRLFRAPAGDSLRRAIHLPRAAYGMSFAHFGLAVSIAGISASAFDVEAIETVRIGSDLTVAGYVLRLDRCTTVAWTELYRRRCDRRRSAATGRLVAVMHPERRFFPLQQQTTSETAIRTNLLSDLYVALGERDDAGNWTLRAYWKPLVPWIWIGAVIMAFGGMVSLSDRRWRIGAAARARRSGPLLQPAAGE